jgi:chemosensory pili system protein ChpC
VSREPTPLRVLILPGYAAVDHWDPVLPAAAVAEILRTPILEPADGGVPDWLAGYIDWQGLRLPLIRPVNTVAGSEDRSGALHAAVCFAPGGAAQLPFFAIASPAVPRLEEVTPADLSAETRVPPPATGPFILTALRLAGRSAGLLDLDAIERALLGLPAEA